MPIGHFQSKVKVQRLNDQSAHFSVGLSSARRMITVASTSIIMIPPFCFLWILVTCSNIKRIIWWSSLFLAAGKHANNAKTD